MGDRLQGEAMSRLLGHHLPDPSGALLDLQSAVPQHVLLVDPAGHLHVDHVRNRRVHVCSMGIETDTVASEGRDLDDLVGPPTSSVEIQ